ncbi:peptidase domain-containing ABC transporter [Pelosinus baikalensis]|uniref:peptidase domain-containing ABC transporter n=1 Tax=Pelosinus baikalensis TaxID=2892015 RepID=UPI00272956F5|nr:ATP-binding cassette domain-containing protein [Pelosinus baikalensis]
MTIHLIDNKLTVGQLIAFQMLSGKVFDPILRLVYLWQDFQQARISIEKLGDILNESTEPSFNPNQIILPAIKGNIVFEQVSFRYSINGPIILDRLNLDIRPGTVVGIAGRSGSGKSTLVKLIQRLYLPESGRILIDGTDITQIEPAWLRRQIGVVSQENYLFNGTIRDNIAINNPGMDMKEIINAAQLAGAHEFIVELPENYNTLVGERGTSLSGGQRQRIAIARALIENPRLLIFDEATSALDYQSERIIQKNLYKICQNRTVFNIAHRLSTIQHSNIIIVIDRGRVVEMGTHKELLNQKNFYYDLYMQQEG